MTTISQLTRPGWTRPGRPAGTATGATGERERLWLPLAILAAAVIGVVGWMLLVSPLRADTGEAQSQTVGVTRQVDTLRSQLAQFQAEKADLPRFTADLQAAQAALPTTAALPTFLRTLQDLGTHDGVDVTGLTATPPTPVTATGAGAAGRTAAPVYQVGITLTAAGGYDGLTAFVRDLQQTQPRAVLVTGTSVSADSDGTTLTLALAAFLAPGGGATAGG